MFKLFDNKALLVEAAGPALKVTALAARSLVLDDALARERAVGVISAQTLPPVTPPAPTPLDIPKDSALGRVRETSAVARRLEVTPSVEFANIARQTKERFFVGGLKLLARAGYALEDIPVTGFVVETQPPAAPGAAAPAPQRLPIEDAADLLALYAPGSLAKVVDADDDAQLQPGEQTEGRFFALGLNSVDSTVRFLRNLETRTDDYRRLQTEARGARERLQGALARLTSEIGALDTRLAEVRHDLAVARSLRAEEEQRVAALLARRRAILAEHVPYLVFRRPMFARALDDAPVLPAEPALVADALPTALAQTDELLPELQQMVDSLRDVPARWFRKAAPLFDRFDRTLSIERLAGAAFDRIEALVAVGGRTIDFDADGSKAAQQLRRTFDGHADRVLRLAQEARVLRASALGGSAKNALEAVRRFASVADLLRAAPPLRELSLAAAGLLDEIGNVAQSLYERFSDVPPATRLRWAELYSELDTSVLLRQLTVLPDFGNEALGVDFIQWRQMQQLVDWLFLQVDADEQAVAAINDLVRVCLLLSAHAPVRRILSARIRRPVPTVVDTRMELDLDSRVARIGMQVLVHAPQGASVVARAVIEDLSASGGVARITQVLVAQQTTLDASHRVQLQAGAALSTNSAAQADRARADTRRAQAQVQTEVRQEALASRQLRGAGTRTLNR
jgi:hypothetical protein